MFFRETLRGIPLPTRQAQRRREGTSGAIPAFVPDDATLIRPTAPSRKPIYPRPGKRSAAGQDTSGAIPAFVPDGGFALSGLREPPVSPYTVGPASAAPPGRTPQTPYPFLCRMALRLSGLREPPVSPYTVGPASAAPPGDDHRHGAAFMPGGGSRLARHTVRATCR